MRCQSQSILFFSIYSCQTPIQLQHGRNVKVKKELCANQNPRCQATHARVERNRWYVNEMCDVVNIYFLKQRIISVLHGTVEIDSSKYSSLKYLGRGNQKSDVFALSRGFS